MVARLPCVQVHCSGFLTTCTPTTASPSCHTWKCYGELTNHARDFSQVVFQVTVVSRFAFTEDLDVRRVTEGRSCLWLLVDSASKIFQCAERRVYKLLKLSAASDGIGCGRARARSGTKRFRGRSAKRARSESGPSLRHNVPAAAAVDKIEDYDLQMVLEANPKWQLLLQVLEEIEQAQTCEKQQQQAEEDAATAKDGGGAAGTGTQRRRTRPWLGTSTEPAPPVLVIGADQRTCSQLSEVLDHVDGGVRRSDGTGGPTERYLQTQFSRYVLKKAASQGWQVAKAKQRLGANGAPISEASDEEEHDAVVAAAAAGQVPLLPGQEEAEAQAAAAERQLKEEQQPLSTEVIKQRAERKLLYQEARRYARRDGYGKSMGDSREKAGDGRGRGGAAVNDYGDDEPDGSSPTFDAHFGVYAAPHVLVHSLGTLHTADLDIILALACRQLRLS